MGLTLAPSILNEISETAKWLGREMGEVRRTEQGLAWNRAEDAPTTIRHRGVRVDFAQKGETFDIKKVAEKEDSGLWIAPDLVMLWTTRMGQFAVPLFDANSQSERFNKNKDFPVGETIPGDRFEPMALQNLRLLTPVLLVAWQGLGMLVVYLLFLSMFTTIPILLRGPQSVGGFRVSLCVNLYCSVIPFIIATVYSRAAPRTMDFMTVFLFAFFGYLIWSFSRVRRFLSGS
jgi:hypothetical protein